MYCVLNTGGKVIACHDEERVCMDYVKGIYNSHKICYSVRKLKKGIKHRIKDFDNYYLVRLGEIYVQREFIDCYEISSRQMIDDNHTCKDLLLQILEYGGLGEKETKVIKKAISVVSDICDETDGYVPLPDELKEIKMQYAAYFNNITQEE